MVQIIITPYIHLQYFDLFFSQQTWLNPVLLLFCRWKCLEKIMGMLASLTFNAYPLTSNGPFLATLQHFLTDNHFTSYSLQAHGAASAIFMFSWWPTFSFTKKTGCQIRIPVTFHSIVTPKVLCDHLFLLAVRGGPSYSASQYRYAWISSTSAPSWTLLHLLFS